jgi:hypothetical protein
MSGGGWMQRKTDDFCRRLVPAILAGKAFGTQGWTI